MSQDHLSPGKGQQGLEPQGVISQEELFELQTRLSFQEDTINELSLIVARQDRQLLALAKQLGGLVNKFDDAMFEREQGDSAADERPPHY